MCANCKTRWNTRSCSRARIRSRYQGIAGGSAIAGRVAADDGLPGARSGPCARLDDMERNAILEALAQTHGNKKKAAELLGIQRPTLYNKMKRYAIEL